MRGEDQLLVQGVGDISEAEKEAEKLGVPFLGSIPLDIDIRQSGDNGQPAKGDFFEKITSNLVRALKA